MCPNKSVCCFVSQRSHSASGSVEGVWRSFPAVEWVMSSENSIHIRSQGAVGLCLPGIHYNNSIKLKMVTFIKINVINKYDSLETLEQQFSNWGSSR